MVGLLVVGLFSLLTAGCALLMSILLFVVALCSLVLCDNELMSVRCVNAYSQLLKDTGCQTQESLVLPTARKLARSTQGR